MAERRPGTRRSGNHIETQMIECLDVVLCRLRHPWLTFRQAMIFSKTVERSRQHRQTIDGETRRSSAVRSYRGSDGLLGPTAWGGHQPERPGHRSISVATDSITSERD
jgi:hypothetical protein